MRLSLRPPGAHPLMADALGLVDATELADGVLRLRDGGLRAALEVRPLSLLLRRVEEQAEVYQAYRQWLDGLTTPVSLHVLTEVLDPRPVLAHYQRRARAPLTPELGAWIRGEARVVADHLHAHQLLEPRFLVIAACDPSTRRRREGWSRTGRAGTAAPAVHWPEAARLEERCIGLREGLGRVGVGADRLGDGDWFGVLQRAYGGASGGEPATLRAWLAPRHVRLHADRLRVDGTWCRSLALTGYPRTVRMGWLGQLLGGFGRPGRLALHIRPLAKAVVLGQLRRKIRAFETTTVVDDLQGRRTDTGTRAVLADATRLEEQILLDEERLFHLEIVATVLAATEDELGERSAALATVLAELGCRASWLRHRQLDGWRSTLPLGASRLGWVRDLPSSALATTFPFLRNSLPAGRGVLLGHNRLENGLVFLDAFADAHPNANTVVVGTSGAGKSYTAKLLVARSAAEGVHIRCIDPADEYRTLVLGLGGEAVTLGLGTPTRLNPLDLRAGSATDPQAARRDKVAQLLPILTLLAGRPAGRAGRPTLRPGELAAMETALIDLYRAAGLPDGDPDPDPDRQPRLQQLAERVADQGHRGLAARLGRFTEGVYGTLLDQPTTVRLDAPLLTFGIRSLAAYGDRLLPAVLAMLFGHLQAELVARPGPRRLLVVDEAEVVLRHPPSALALEGLSRRLRKHGAGLLVASQVVEDLLGSSAGSVIVRNSHVKLLLRQEPVALPQVTTAFGLSRGAADLLAGADPGCGLALVGRDQAAFRGLASPDLHRWITTHPAEASAAG